MERQPIHLSQLIANREALTRRIKKANAWYEKIGNSLSNTDPKVKIRTVKPDSIENIKKMGETKRDIAEYSHRASTQIKEVDLGIMSSPEAHAKAQVYLNQVEKADSDYETINDLRIQGHVEDSWGETARNKRRELKDKPKNDEILELAIEGLRKAKEDERRKHPISLTINAETGEVTAQQGETKEKIHFQKKSARRQVFDLFTQHPRELISDQQIKDRVSESGIKSQPAALVEGVRQIFMGVGIDNIITIHQGEKKGKRGKNSSSYALNADVIFTPNKK